MQHFSSLWSLNPCFNGIWSASVNVLTDEVKNEVVLILVLMEYGLRVYLQDSFKGEGYECLNPCFNGIWSARNLLHTIGGIV